MTTAHAINPATPSANLPVVSDLASLSPAGSGGLAHYLRLIQSFSLLTPEREVELSRCYREKDDLDAAQQLILANLRFVVHIARKYQGYGLPLQDIIQEGNIGLMRAVQKFDPGYGVRLISFAAYWIKAEIHEFVMRNWRIVKVSTTRAQRKLFFKLRSMLPDSTSNSLSNDEAKEIATQLDCDTSDVLEMEVRMKSQDISLEDDRQSSDGSSYQPAQQLFSQENGPEQSAEEDNWQKVIWEKIHQKIDTLDERSRDILRSRWMQENKTTLEELAEKYSVSIERIRQIEKASIQKIRAHLDPELQQA